MRLRCFPQIRSSSESFSDPSRRGNRAEQFPSRAYWLNFEAESKLPLRIEATDLARELIREAIRGGEPTARLFRTLSGEGVIKEAYASGEIVQYEIETAAGDRFMASESDTERL